MLTSLHLVTGRIYSRKDLMAEFNIKDSTINTGIFRPKGHDSIWLFVTENKTADRTPYTDVLKGDDLHMDGQRAGRTDAILIGHAELGLEVLLFYRQSKNQHPEYAFRYEGKFYYVSHQGTRPAHFYLRRFGSLSHG